MEHGVVILSLLFFSATSFSWCTADALSLPVTPSSHPRRLQVPGMYELASMSSHLKHAPLSTGWTVFTLDIAPHVSDQHSCALHSQTSVRVVSP